MPVIQLRTPADYFGINEAPQQPLFQASREVDPDIAFHRQMVGLRQQRPLAQAQAIQNQYSTIFNNAEKLRLEQQAAKEAEQAVSALAGLTPEVDDYITQRQEIQRQFPNAMLDPRVQRIVDDNDRMFSSRQSSLAKQQNEAADRRAKLFGMGATPQQVEAVFQNPDAAAQLEFQLGKGGGGGLHTERYKLLKDSVENARKAYSTAYDNMREDDAASVEKLKTVESRLGKLEADLAAEEDRLLDASAPTASAAKEPATPAAAAAPTPFMDTMKKGAGQAPTGEGAVPSITLQEEIEDINSIADDPNALIEAIRSGNRSAEAKKVALERLRQFAKAPKFPFGTTTREANSRIKEAERNVRMIPELEAYRKAWTEEKKDMELKIKDFAKSRGVDFDLTLADLAKEEPASNDPEETFTVRDQFEEFLNKEYDPGPILRALSIGQLNIPAGRLMKFKDSEFAKEFGWWQPIPLLRLPIERGDVLDAYLAEKFPNQGDNQGQSTNAAADTVANITTEAEFDKLPIGAKFTFGSGEIRTKERERKK